MTNILLVISIIIISAGYLIILITSITSKEKSDETAADAVIRITSDDNSIHLVESSDSYLNKYLIKRKIIKLTTKTYNSKSIFKVSIAYLLSGYSKLTGKAIDTLSKIMPYLYYISFTPIITIIISLVVTTSMDAKVGIIFLIIISIYQYIIYNLNLKVTEIVKSDNGCINKNLNQLVLISKSFFVATVIQIFRMVLMI